MERHQLIQLINRIPEDVPTDALEASVLETYRKMGADELALAVQGPSVQGAPKKAKRKERKKNTNNKPKAPAELNERDNKLLETIGKATEEKPATLGFILEHHKDLSKSQVQASLRKLKGANKLKMHGTTRTARYTTA